MWAIEDYNQKSKGKGKGVPVHAMKANRVA
jgi:hypothetical protein